MIGTHKRKKKRDVPHIYKIQDSDSMYYADGRFPWVCEHGVHCAHGKNQKDAREWFRIIYGY